MTSYEFKNEFGEEVFDDFVGRQRGKAIAEDEFDFSGELDRSDVSIKGSRGRAVVDTSGYLEGDKFDEFTEQAKSSDAFAWNPANKTNRVKKSAMDRVPDPREVHESRSEYAQKQDEAREAEITTDPAEYARDPDSHDFPLVDTPESVNEDIVPDDTRLRGYHLKF